MSEMPPPGSSEHLARSVVHIDAVSGKRLAEYVGVWVEELGPEYGNSFLAARAQLQAGELLARFSVRNELHGEGPGLLAHSGLALCIVARTSIRL